MKEISPTPLCGLTPSAYANLKGSPSYPNLRGLVWFCRRPQGILVQASVEGLPFTTGKCSGNFYGFHLHGGASCTGTAQEPFANANGHYNPAECPHPLHAGDFPPLLGCRGIAWSAFLTDRFTLDEIIGRTVIIHEHPDDFRTQPSGNSGAMIACGVVQSVK